MSAIQLALAIAPLSIGIYIAFRILRYPDLTCEGSFALGGAVIGLSLVNNINPILAVLLSIIAGLIAGVVTGMISERLNIPPIIASILTLTSLYSVNLILMDQPILSLRGTSTIFDIFHSISGISETSPDNNASILFDLVILLILIFALILLLNWFFKTETGLRLRATGANLFLAPSLGINVKFLTILGLAIVNLCNALGGSIAAQIQGFSDVNMGLGMLVLGLAGVYIGQVIEVRLIRKSTLLTGMISVVVGIVIYYIILQFALSLGIKTVYFNLLNALIVLFVILIPMIKESTSRAINRF